jgi:hypothetical protein
MSDQIELHDSRVAVHFADATLVLHFCPAYVHHWHRSSNGWRGEGLSQSAEIVVSQASVLPSPPNGAHDISGGWLQVGTLRYDNLIPVPLALEGDVRGRLELLNCDAVDFNGEAVTIRLLGEAEFVEDRRMTGRRITTLSNEPLERAGLTAPGRSGAPTAGRSAPMR